MEHAISSLLDIFSFSHRACDDLWQLRGPNVGLFKRSTREDDFYLGFFFVLAWEAFMLIPCISAWRKPLPTAHDRVRRYTYIPFALFGLVVITLQLEAMVQYVDVCRDLLHGGNGRAATANASSGYDYIFVLITGLLAFVSGSVLIVRAKALIQLGIQLDIEKGWAVDTLAATIAPYLTGAFLIVAGLVIIMAALQGITPAR